MEVISRTRPEPVKYERMTRLEDLRLKEKIEAACLRLSREEVVRRLAFYAQRLSSHERMRLLEEFSPENDHGPSLPRVLTRVEEFVNRVWEGEFAEYTDYDPEFGYECVYGDDAWEQELRDILIDLNRIFDSGRRVEVAQAYSSLLHLLDEALNEGLLPESCGFHFEIDDLKARFLRGLYEELPLQNRAEQLLEEFLGPHGFEVTIITLKDIEDVADDPLPDLEEFLPRWRRALEQSGDRLDIFQLHELSMEAWFRVASTEEIFEQIRSQARQDPDAWVVFSHLLHRHGRRDDALAAAEEGLSTITVPESRSNLGVFLAVKALEAGIPELALTGFREAFRASGQLQLLLLLLDELEDDPDLLKGVVEEEYDHLAGQETDGRLLTRLALLAGKYDHAARLLSDAAARGWASPGSAVSLTVAALLVGSAGQCPEDSCIERIWRKHDRGFDGFEEWRYGDFGLFPDTKHSLFERLEESLAARSLEENERLGVLAVLRPIVEERVRTTVRRKATRAYPDVALLSAALAEALALNGRPTEGKRSHHGLVAEFPRHWAFRREMEAALQASPVLR